MNQENSQSTEKSIETNPAEGETHQDENNDKEDFVEDTTNVKSVSQVNEGENQVNENESQENENENQLNETESQVTENDNQVNETVSQVNETESQDNETEGQVNENETQLNEKENQVAENEEQCCDTESEMPSEIISQEPVTESNELPDSNAECVSKEKPLEADSDVTSIKEEGDQNDEPENEESDSKPGESPKGKPARGKRQKSTKSANCDKYGWPIGSKYCTEMNSSANDNNFAEDVDLALCEMEARGMNDKDAKKFTQPEEEILYVVKSPLHRTANTKRTIVRVEEVEGAITDGIHAGTHLPHFLNYLSLQVKFKFTLVRLPDKKLKITFRFVGKGGESLKNIICLWLRREDEDKDKIICDGLTRNKENTLAVLAKKFREIESLKEDVIPLYEEIKKLVPELRGKEGLRSEDKAFLKEYKNLDDKLLLLIMLLFKSNCGCRGESKLVSKFRDLYFSLQLNAGFTVKQYLYAFYCYNMMFTPYLPQELQFMMNKFAKMKNITLPDTPPLVIPECGQKSTLTVINPFAKKKLQGVKQEDNRANKNSYAEYEMVPVKTDGIKAPSKELAEGATKKLPARKPNYRRNRRVVNRKNNMKNLQTLKSPQGQRSNPQGQRGNPQGQRSNPQGQRSNPQGQKSNPQGQRSNPQNSLNPKSNLNNRNARIRRNIRNQNLLKQTLQNPRNLGNQRNQGSLRNPANKRQQGVQGGTPAKKRIVDRSNSGERETLPNPVASDQGTQENSAALRNPKTPNRRRQQSQRRQNQRQRRKLSNQLNNDNPRNNQPNQRSNQQPNQRSNQQPRNIQQNQRNPQNKRNQQNQRNSVQNRNSNMRNEKNNPNERNNQRNARTRKRSDLRKHSNPDQYFGMSDMPQRFSSNDHEFLLNSLRNQDLMQNMRNQDMGRNPNFNNERNPMFSQSNSRNQNFSQGNSPRQSNFSPSNQPRSLFAQQYFDLPRNQNYSSNNSGNQNFSSSNSRRPWSSDFAGSSQNYFSGSNNFPNRLNSMQRNLGDMSFSNYNSRMSFDEDMHAHNFMNSNNHNWDDDFNRGKRKNMRDDWNSKRSKQGI